MTKCNQCGKMNAAGAVNCQSCGTSLSSMVESGMSPRPTSLEQPELPAWLESLRAGERSASPTNTATNFSAADFVDENSLPSWMRAERNETRDNTGANPSVSVRPSSLSNPTTDGEHQSSTGIAARSLLDEQALPSWMREGKQPNPVSTQEKIAASSLVQPENMPDWMKSLQRDKAPFSGEASSDGTPPLSMSSPHVPVTPQWSAGGSPSGSQSSSLPVTPPAFSGQGGFSARDLINPQSLPSWMVQQDERAGQPSQPAGPQGPTGGSFPASPSASSPMPSVIPPGQGGFSARDLINPQSLPSWMVQQGERAGQPSQPAGPQGGPTGGSFPASPSASSPMPSVIPPGQGGFSARDLINPQSLPSWMVQQGERAGQPSQPLQVPQPGTGHNAGPLGQGQTFPASSLLDMNSLPSWLREREQGGQQGHASPLANQSFPTSAGNPPAPAFGGNIPASSFLDTNSVPEWMRQSDPQPPKHGFGATPPYQPTASYVPGTPQPNIYAGPPKVENIRVPNRPRNEINPNENNEVAANVFSSMLGVASSTPSYPVSSPQPNQSYQQPRPPANPAQPNMGHSMNQSGMSSSTSANYAGPGLGAVPNRPSTSSNTQQGYGYTPPGHSYGSSSQGRMSSSQMGNPSSAGMSYGSSTATPGQKAAGTTNEHKSTKKRGLFGAILEWLTR